MSRFTRIQVINTILETGIIPIFYHPDAGICKNVIKACYEGGLRSFEFTNRGDFALDVFRELSHFAAATLPDMVLGTGSIMDAATASLYIQYGSGFIVAPVLHEDTGLTCNRRKVLWIPGCGSVTEISRAEELGAEFIKIFPARQVGGPSFIEAVRGPMPWSRLMPSGGVEPTEESLKSWFAAGAACVSMGSQLIRKEWVEKQEWEKLSEACHRSLLLTKKYRKG